MALPLSEQNILINDLTFFGKVEESLMALARTKMTTAKGGESQTVFTKRLYLARVLQSSNSATIQDIVRKAVLDAAAAPAYAGVLASTVTDAEINSAVATAFDTLADIVAGD